jgi:hypothetical protein
VALVLLKQIAGLLDTAIGKYPTGMYRAYLRRNGPPQRAVLIEGTQSIVAVHSLVLNTSATNLGLLEATGGGQLKIDASILENGASGVVQAVG